jgi:hypothetical protein
MPFAPGCTVAPRCDPPRLKTQEIVAISTSNPALGVILGKSSCVFSYHGAGIAASGGIWMSAKIGA